MEIKQMNSMRLLVNNLNNFLIYKNLITVKNLAAYLSINYSRLVSWLNFQRTPPLLALDKIADSMQVFSKDLIGSKIDFSTYSFIIGVANSSPEKFCINLRKYLNKYDVKSAEDFVAFFGETFSEHTYYSYFKKKNKKNPSLKTLEILSTYLSISPNKLIE